MEENNKDFYQTGSTSQDDQTAGILNDTDTTVQQDISAQQNVNAEQNTAEQQNANAQYEQRPSQLYGRTAYQQQNAQNQPNGNAYGYQNNNPYGSQNIYQNNNPYGNQNGYQNNNPYGNQNGYQNNPYGNQNGYQNNNQNYYNNPNGSFNRAYGNPNGKVSNVFCYILLVIMPLANIVSILMYNMVFNLMEGLSYADFETEYMQKVMQLSGEPAYLLLAMLTYALGIGYIVFVILDIVKIHKQQYKITGLILFAIFLKPGYYIWRAHVLGEKKTIPVIYTIGYCSLVLGQVIFFIVRVMTISMEMVEAMY